MKNNTTTGAIHCYLSNNTRLTTEYEQGSVIYLTYFSAGSISINGTATSAARWIAQADAMGSGEEGDTAYYDVGTEEIGSASAGTPIAADDITEWSAGTAPSLTVTSTAVGTSVTAPTGTAATAAVSNGTLTLTNSSTPVTSVTLNTSNIGSASN